MCSKHTKNQQFFMLTWSIFVGLVTYGFYTPEVGDTYIRVFQFGNLIVKALYWRSTTQVEALSRFNQYSLVFHTLFIQSHTLFIQRLSFVLITLQVTLTFTCGVLLFQQPLHNHHARLLQLCKVANTLHKLPQLCDNLTKLQQGCYNLVIFVWGGKITKTFQPQLKLQQQPWLLVGIILHIMYMQYSMFTQPLLYIYTYLVICYSTQSNSKFSVQIFFSFQMNILVHMYQKQYNNNIFW